MHVTRLVSRLIFKAIKRFRRSEPDWENVILARLRYNDTLQNLSKVYA